MRYTIDPPRTPDTGVDWQDIFYNVHYVVDDLCKVFLTVCENAELTGHLADMAKQFGEIWLDGDGHIIPLALMTEDHIDRALRCFEDLHEELLKQGCDVDIINDRLSQVYRALAYASKRGYEHN